MSENKIKIAAIVGPTASGKTSLSIALAKMFNGEIISCDSMQIYRGMSIGTAKPSHEEMEGIPHHLIDCCDPDCSFSVAEYLEKATIAVNDIYSRGRLPIFCGGTGLYLSSFLRGGLSEAAGGNELYREELMGIAREHGVERLHSMLAEVDPESAAKTHPNNVKRVIRALEVFHLENRPKSEFDKLSQEKESPYDATVIGIRFNCRELLYSRIDQRVDKMISDGLVEETRRLRNDGIFQTNSTASQAIGYKELFPYLDGDSSLEEAIEVLKRSTRKYAKRQLTWFNSMKNITWIDADKENKPLSFEDIVNNSKNVFIENGLCDIIY